MASKGTILRSAAPSYLVFAFAFSANNSADDSTVHIRLPHAMDRVIPSRIIPMIPYLVFELSRGTQTDRKIRFVGEGGGGSIKRKIRGNVIFLAK